MRPPLLASVSRRGACHLLIAGLVGVPLGPSALAFEVASRTEQQKLELQLYAPPAPTVVSYRQQVSDAITIKSMRGVWQLQETFTGGGTRSGTLLFRGAETEVRGTVSYSGEAASGRGPWILKSDGFGRSPTGKGGAIEQKVLWKLRRGAGGTFTYAARVNVASYGPDGLPDASVDGEIIELVNGGKPKGGYEKKVGTFRAVLKRQLRPEEEEAVVSDGAAAGGAPQALQLTPVMDGRLVYRKSD
jgi:hypothetical protein